MRSPPDDEAPAPRPHECWGRVGLTPAERHLLRMPAGRLHDLARVGRIALEFMRGFGALRALHPCVTVFGSARFGEGHRYYDMARQVGTALAGAGFSVLTGGGPGVMEGANRGAMEAGGLSAGCNIDLPLEQRPNAFLNRWVGCRYFFVRKVMLVRHSCAFVALPGGFGTLDEVFETATLIQTGKVADFPLILMGTSFWEPLLGFVRDRLRAEGAIDEYDHRRLLVTDSPDEAVACTVHCATERFGLIPSRARAEAGR